jgi:hypothetical protein
LLFLLAFLPEDCETYFFKVVRQFSTTVKGSFTVQARDTDGNVSPMSGTGSFSTLSYPAGGAIKGIICQLTSTTVTFSAICWWTA